MTTLAHSSVGGAMVNASKAVNDSMPEQTLRTVVGRQAASQQRSSQEKRSCASGRCDGATHIVSAITSLPHREDACDRPVWSTECPMARRINFSASSLLPSRSFLIYSRDGSPISESPSHTTFRNSKFVQRSNIHHEVSNHVGSVEREIVQNASTFAISRSSR